jgi:RNA polymerase sigma factor (sigma-70 family)
MTSQLTLDKPPATSFRPELGSVTKPGNCGISVLIAAARSGDESAWNELVRSCESVVVMTTRRYRLSPTDAADVSQNVWLTVFRRLESLREPSSVTAWIGTIARNACLDVVTSQRRTTPVDFSVVDTARDPWPGMPSADRSHDSGIDDGLRREECRRAVREGLAELTPPQRDLLLLLVADPPLSYRQISRRLGVPIGSIGPSRARLLKKLGDTAALRRLLGEPESRISAPLAA